MKRTNLSVAAVVAALLTVSACSSSSSGGSSATGTSSSTVTPSSTSTAPSSDSTSPSATDSTPPATTHGAGDGTDQNINNEGTPVKGGTLHMLGIGDVDYLDANVTYYSTGYTAARLYARQLVTFPATPGKATTDVPDLATELPTADNGGISKDGLTYTFTIRDGVKWDTKPVRPVTGDDFVRGVKRICNPAQPFGGLPNFQTLIAGFDDYCKAYAKVNPKDAKAMADYQNSHEISGAKASGQKVIFTLVHPASYFLAMLALPAFSAAPKEYDAYVPAGAEIAQHSVSDGPYSIAKYVPTKTISFVRNPAWTEASDPVRKAYVDKIEVNETGKQEVIQQQLQANTPDADMEWDTFPPVSAVPGLIDAKDPNFYLGATFSSNPYILFNTQSPNNAGLLAKPEVRRAISEVINRDNLIQDDNGPDVSPPLTHVLPAGISGTESNTSIDLYKFDLEKGKADLAAAGVPAGTTFKFLYRPESSLSSKLFTTLQQDLGDAGIKIVGVEASQADFYTKYLQVPTQAKAGVWDLSLAGWGPDWYGDAALSFMAPLFQGEKAYPPVGSNFGLYNNPDVNTAIDAAAKESDPAKSKDMWAAIDKKIMEDAAFYPITSNGQPTYHASHVHNTVFIPTYQQNDPANVWLSAK